MRKSDLKIVNLTFQLVVVFNFRLLFACCNDMISFDKNLLRFMGDPFGDQLALRSRRRSRWFPPFFVVNDPAVSTTFRNGGMIYVYCIHLQTYTYVYNICVYIYIYVASVYDNINIRCIYIYIFGILECTARSDFF